MTPAGRDDWHQGSFVDMLPGAEREALLAAGSQVRFSDDQILVHQGDAGDFLYVLTGGLVKVIVTAENGAETALGLRSRGDLIGEFAVMDSKPRTATARAVGPVTAVKINRTAWTAFARERAAAASAFTTYLLGKMRATTECRVAERVGEARERLAQVLYKLAREYGVPDSDGALRLPVTQSELGQFAGVAVSTAERLLAEFRRDGVITTAYGAVVVRDMAYLGSIRSAGESKPNPLPEGLLISLLRYGLSRRRGLCGRTPPIERPAGGGGRSLSYLPGGRRGPPGARRIRWRSGSGSGRSWARMSLAKGSSSLAGMPTISILRVSAAGAVRGGPAPGGRSLGPERDLRPTAMPRCRAGGPGWPG